VEDTSFGLLVDKLMFMLDEQMVEKEKFVYPICLSIGTEKRTEYPLSNQMYRTKRFAKKTPSVHWHKRK